MTGVQTCALPILPASRSETSRSMRCAMRVHTRTSSGLNTATSSMRFTNSGRKYSFSASIVGSAALLCVLALYAFLVSLGLSPWIYILVSGVFAGCVAFLASGQAKIGVVALAMAAGAFLAAGIAWSFNNLLSVDIVS